MMAKKKGAPKKKATPEARDNNSHLPSPVSLPATANPSSTVPAPITPPEPDANIPLISRNKHWQYIASFQGRWFELPLEILESLANLNYNTPRPHPVDPALFFDVVKIRRLVDNATDQALRAATGTVSSFQWDQRGSHQRLHGNQPGREIPLSSQRQLRMRETATENLARAYRLDEIACSVAVMKGPTCLEEVASHVLKRQPENIDALYVHFFHEKIPASRRLPHWTNLAPLDRVLAHSPRPEPWRTRGVVKLFKDDNEGALGDFKWALGLDRARVRHVYETQQLSTREQEDIILKEEEQPSSLNVRLLFHKAAALLRMAVHNVDAAFSPPANNAGPSQERLLTKASPEGGPPEMSQAEGEAQKRILEARKLVKKNARRALHEFMAFLSHFEYTHDLPYDYFREFSNKAQMLMEGKGKKSTRGPRAPSIYKIYKVNELFDASPVDLPPERTSEGPATTVESLTFHPLLGEALHSLLLCHCLVQTSAKELHRHACMVARLSRLCDGYPVFQVRRSLARTDWAEVLRGGNNWIKLDGLDWDELCKIVPKSEREGADEMKTNANLLQAASMLGNEVDEAEVPQEASVEGETWSPPKLDEHERRRITEMAKIEASLDERVTDNETLALATRARELRAFRDAAERGKGAAKLPRGSSEDSSYAITDTAAEKGESVALVSTKTPRRSSFDIRAKNFPIASDRALAIIRWVLEAPPHPGVQTAFDGAPKKTKKKCVDNVSSGATTATKPGDGLGLESPSAG